MDLLQLRYFVETAERLHFAHAAEHLGITQSALSKSIQKMEKELGFQLFSRTNKWDVHLTIPGEMYRKEAIKILCDLDYARNKARLADHGETGRLIIGAISSMLGQNAFIETMSELQKETPHAFFEVIDSTSGELLELLKEHKIDLAFLRLSPEFQDVRFICRKLFDDQLLLVVPKEHRLVTKNKVKVADLRNERFILVPDSVSSVFRNYILDFCRTEGNFEPVIVQEVNNNYTTLRLVAAKCGITVVSSAYRGFLPERLCFLQLSDFQPILPMYAVYPNDYPIPLAERFIRKFLQIRNHEISEEMR